MLRFDDFRGDDNTDRQTDLYFTATHVQGVIKIVTDSSLNFTDTYLEQCGRYDISHTPSEPSPDWPSFGGYVPAHALPRDYLQVLGELVQLKCKWVVTGSICDPIVISVKESPSCVLKLTRLFNSDELRETE